MHIALLCPSAVLVMHQDNCFGVETQLLISSAYLSARQRHGARWFNSILLSGEVRNQSLIRFVLALPELRRERHFIYLLFGGNIVKEISTLVL